MMARLRVSRLPKPAAYGVSFALFLALWFVAAKMGASAGVATFVPDPLDVGESLVGLFESGTVWTHLGKTLVRVGSGFLIAEGLGILVGTLMGLSRVADHLLEGWILMFLTVPSLAYAIFALLAFGLSEFAMIIAIAITTFPYVVVNIVGGVKAVDRDLMQMGKVFRLGRSSTFRHLVVPQIIPYILSSSRYGLGMAWKIAVVVELMGASAGVGYMLRYSFSLLSMTDMLAWTALIVLVMFMVEHLLFRIVELRVSSWRVS